MPFPDPLDQDEEEDIPSTSQIPMRSKRNSKPQLYGFHTTNHSTYCQRRNSPIFVSLLSLLLFWTLGCAGTIVAEAPDPALSTSSPEQFSTAVKESLPDLVFTPFERKTEYKSSVMSENGTDPAIRFVYMAVNSFLDLLQPNPFPSHLYKEEYLQGSQYHAFRKTFSEDYVKWIKYEQGFLIVGGLCLLLALLFSIIYIFYLCCRCCCCRKAKGKPRADNRFDGCRRRAYTAIMSILALIMIFSVACAFVSNQYLHTSAQNMPDNARNVIDDARTYRDENSDRIEKLLLEDYEELNRTLLTAVDKASAAVIVEVKHFTGAIALDRLSLLSAQAVEVLSELKRMERDIRKLEGEARELKSSVDTLYSDVGAELENCGEDKKSCQEARDIFEQSRSIPTSLSDLDTLNSIKQELERFSEKDIERLLEGAVKEFDRLRDKFESGIRGRKQELEEHLEKYGRNLTQYANRIRIELSRVSLVGLESQISQHQDNYAEIELYRWIACLVICSILGLAVGLFGLGLFYGCCGKRPSYYEDDCCVRRTGSKLFCGGITVAVLFLVIFMTITTILFLIGGNTKKMVCDELENPTDQDGLIAFGEKLARRSSPEIGEFLESNNLNVSGLVTSCLSNKTFYTIFDLERRFGLTETMNGQSQEYKELIKDLREMTGKFDGGGQPPQILSPEAERALSQLKNLTVKGIPSDVFEKINEYLESFKVFEEVLALNESLSRGASDEKRKNQLKTVVVRLRKIEEEQATPLEENLRVLLANLTSLNQSIPDISVWVPHWLNHLRNAQSLLQSNLTNYVQSAGKQVGSRMASYVDEYRQHMNHQLRSNIGSCEPLILIASSTKQKICAQTINPLNSYWASIAICLLLLIPTIMLATSLRDLYRNTERFSGSDYSIYDDDYIPLNGEIRRVRGMEPEDADQDGLMPLLRSYSMPQPSRSSRGHSSRSGNQHNRSRVQAYISDTDHYSRAGTAKPTVPERSTRNSRNSNIYGNWRSPPAMNSSGYYEEGPPPPYTSPPRRPR